MSALNGIVTRWPRSLQAEVVLVLAAVLLGLVAGVTGWEAFRALASGALVLAMCCVLWLCWRPVVDGLLEMRSVPGGAAPELVALVARLAASAGLEPPRVRVVRAAQPNAHVRSLREPPQITVTQGLLDRRTELERTGVLGHELGHISAGHDGFFRWRFLPASAATVGAIVTTGALAVLGLESCRCCGRRRLARAPRPRGGWTCQQTDAGARGGSARCVDHRRRGAARGA